MSSLKYFVAAALVAGMVFLSVSNADEQEKKDVTIKQIMETVHKGKDGGKSLLEQAKAGTIKEEDKKKLVEMYVLLGTLKPMKGDAESWKKLNDELGAAAKEYGEGKDEKAVKLAKAATCANCHKAHKQ